MSGRFCPRECRRRASTLRLGTKRSREKEDAMTRETKIATYWTVGMAGGLVVLVVLAYLLGYFEPVATGTS